MRGRFSRCRKLKRIAIGADHILLEVFCIFRRITLCPDCDLSAALALLHSKGGQTRTVYLNQRFRKALLEYSACIRITDPQRPLFVSQKGGHFSANTMCQLFLDIYKAVGSQRCIQPFGKAHLYNQIGQQGRWRAFVGRAGGAFAHIHDPEIHRREL